VDAVLTTLACVTVFGFIYVALAQALRPWWRKRRMLQTSKGNLAFLHYLAAHPAPGGGSDEAMTNTHYGAIVFSGDPACEHPEEELRGHRPSIDLIACGPEEFCWESLAAYTKAHPLRLWETAEVLARTVELDRVAIFPPADH
jgi:hypothetical protein